MDIFVLGLSISPGKTCHALYMNLLNKLIIIDPVVVPVNIFNLVIHSMTHNFMHLFDLSTHLYIVQIVIMSM